MAGLLSIQTEPFINNREKNIEKVENLIDRHKDKKLDLVLFPEFFSKNVSNFVNGAPFMPPAAYSVHSPGAAIDRDSQECI